MQLPLHLYSFGARSGGAVCRFSRFLLALIPSLRSIDRYKKFKNFEKRILVATDIFGRGIDVERVNIVINYDSPGDADSYLHRVG